MHHPIRRAHFVLAFLFVVFSAMAHRYHVAITTITRDSENGNIEIEHRLFMHDLEPVLIELQEESINFDSAEGEAAIRAYVESHFLIRDTEQKPLQLQWVGVELDQTFATIYQEVPNAPALKQLQYDNQLLAEIATQVNTVNLNEGLQHGSLVFAAGAKSQTWQDKNQTK